MRRTILCCGILLSGVAVEATAQAGAELKPGDEVRVEAPGVKGIFVLRHVGADEVVVGSMGSDVTHTIRVESLKRFDVSRGRNTRGHGFVRGAGWGFVAGGVIGAVLGYADGDDKGGFLPMSAGEKALVGGIILGGAGAVVGGVAGAAHPGRRWERVSVQRIALAPRKAGAGAAVTLSF